MTIAIRRPTIFSVRPYLEGTCISMCIRFDLAEGPREQFQIRCRHKNALRQIGLDYKLESCRGQHEGRRVQMIRFFTTVGELLERADQFDEFLERLKTEQCRVSVKNRITNECEVWLY